ncbi:hypothetical protein Q7P36_010396 [Cladosporium allicinum]
MSNGRIRRQNHSCEQCRRSRKACDGYALNLHSSSSPIPDHRLLPCSYCTKTSKCCSLNLYWGEVVPAAARTLSASSADTQNEALHSVRHIKRQRTSSTTGTDRPITSTAHPFRPSAAPTSTSEARTDANEVRHDTLPSFATPSSSNNSYWDDPALRWDGSFDLSPSYPFPAEVPSLPSGSSSGEDVLPYAVHTAPLQTPYQGVPPVNQLPFEYFPNFPISNGSYASSLDVEGSAWLNSTEDPSLQYPQANSTQPPFPQDETEDIYASEKSALAPRSKRHAISPYSTDYEIMASINHSLITDSLLGIYHDVLENNLACWLSEDTCPYKMKPRRGSELSRIKPTTPANNSTRHSGDAAWPNRMIRRVIQLDRAAQKIGQVQLTQSEGKAASKALSLAILAFATQWSQGLVQGRTQQSAWSTNPLDEGNEFEQNVRMSTWDQARRALEDCSQLESYRVVYAELVFGLVQKPSIRQNDTESTPYGHTESILARSRREVTKILATQSQPVFIERATRKIHAMKFRLDIAETGFSAFSDGGAKPQEAELSAEERSTIGLVYWFAVMLDTVSSSLNEKPVTVTDEDCQPEDDVANEANESKSLVHQRWEARLFVQDDLEIPSATLSWPCSYHEAAEAVVRSAPVKVLLFRYISYLQNTLRKRQFGRPIEDVIGGALLLYKYWGMTYGSFFRSLIRDYSNVPPRIKGWFVCIVVPWHLGALMLADFIDFVDSNGLGSEESSRRRKAENLASKIREASASELADIAFVTTPSEKDAGGRQLPDLHFAVNQGSLLTEPWTILLVNAFAKAALYHLGVLDGLETQEALASICAGEKRQRLVRRIDACAQCLWFLGRKTAIAGDIAVLLLKAIKQYKG